MLAKENTVLRYAQFLQNASLDPEFLVEPSYHCFAKHACGFWVRAEHGHQDALKLDQRLFVKDDVIKILAADAALRETKIYRQIRNIIVVLLATKALLFRGRDQIAITNQRRCRVVVETGNAEDVHSWILGLLVF